MTYKYFVADGDECLKDTSISETLKEYVDARRIIERNEKALFLCQDKIEEFMNDNDIEIIECRTDNKDVYLTVTDKSRERLSDEFINMTMFKNSDPDLYKILCKKYPVNKNYDCYEFDLRHKTEIEIEE